MEETTVVAGEERLPAGSAEELAGPVEAPVRDNQRLPSLDILRGFALLGILLLNVADFAGHELYKDIPFGLAKPALVGWHAHLDFVLMQWTWLFAEGKMRGLFAMLFGAGVVLLTERIERRSGAGRARAVFYGRNLWLLCFGLFHGFVLWSGDVLSIYAAIGMVMLYPLRRLRARSLLVVGLCLACVGGTFASVRAWHVREILRADAQLSAARRAGPAATGQQRALLAAAAQKQAGAAAAIAEDLREGRLGFVEGWPHRVQEEIGSLRYAFGSLRVLEVVGLMIVGMGLYKSGYLVNRRPSWEYVLVAAVGYAAVFPAVLLGLSHLRAAGYSAAANALWMSIPYCVEVVAGSLANASVLLLLIRSGWLRAVFKPLAAVGRTAFSNYILTTAVCQTVFAWGPWKLYGRLEFYQWYLVVAAVWVLNLAFSTVWLRVFAFGPLEWLWRSLTYGKRQPLRLRA